MAVLFRRHTVDTLHCLVSKPNPKTCDAIGLSILKSHQTIRVPNVFCSCEKARNTTRSTSPDLLAQCSNTPRFHPPCLEQTACQTDREITNRQCHCQPSSASPGALPKDLLDHSIHHLCRRRRSSMAHLLRILFHSQSSRGYFHAADNRCYRRLAAAEQEI